MISQSIIDWLNVFSNMLPRNFYIITLIIFVLLTFWIIWGFKSNLETFNFPNTIIQSLKDGAPVWNMRLAYKNFLKYLEIMEMENT